ncbi:hypothetical protein VTN96DRAFT_8530 [Rasamsonia emersonii]
MEISAAVNANRGDPDRTEMCGIDKTSNCRWRKEAEVRESSGTAELDTSPARRGFWVILQLVFFCWQEEKKQEPVPIYTAYSCGNPTRIKCACSVYGAAQQQAFFLRPQHSPHVRTFNYRSWKSYNPPCCAWLLAQLGKDVSCLKNAAKPRMQYVLFPRTQERSPLERRNSLWRRNQPPG